MTITRAQAIPHVSSVIDDAFGRHSIQDILSNAILIGWQHENEQEFVAVQSCLPNTVVESTEATEIATDLMMELPWFEARANLTPDYIII